MAWTPGDNSGSQTLTPDDHLYNTHINELRTASDSKGAVATPNTWSAAQTFNAGMLLDKGSQVFNITAYGAKVDGATDDTAAVIAAMTACYNAGGGTIFFPVGTCLCLGALPIPYNNAATNPVQKPMRFTGTGAMWASYLTGFPVQTGGSILDLRYDGTDGLHPAKIDTRGSGWFELDHLTIKSGGSDNFQIMQTTNTAIFVHDNAIYGNNAGGSTSCAQDFLRCGNTGTLQTNLANAGFQGYGTIIRDNFYNAIRCGTIFGNGCNSIQISNETFSNNCGSNDATLGAPYRFEAGSGAVRFFGGTVEMSSYKYAVNLTGANHYIDGLSTFDENGYAVGVIYCAAGATNCIVVQNNSTSLTVMAGPNALSNTLISSQNNNQTYFNKGLSANGLVANASGAGVTFQTQVSGANRFSVNSTGGTDTFGFNGSNWSANNVAAINFAGNSFVVLSGTAVPAGGATGAAVKVSSTSGLGTYFGSGVPTVSAAQGSLYMRTDGSSTSTRLYVNTNGSTGWTNVPTAT